QGRCDGDEHRDLALHGSSFHWESSYRRRVGAPGAEAPRFPFGFLYGTSTPSTKSWIAPAARPLESTVSVPARVLISRRSFAASGWKIATVGARPFTCTPPASPLTLIVSSLLVALTTTRSGWPSPVAPPRVPATSTFTLLTSVPLRSL